MSLLPESRSLALALGTAFLAVLASPVCRNLRPVEDRRDGFPLSHYPMFSAHRKRTGRVVHARVRYTDGTWEDVGYMTMGSGGFNQVRRQVARRAGTPEGAQALAAQVLATLRGTGEEVDRVDVVKSSFRYAEFMAGDTTARSREVLGTAEVA
ncbi:hypothetical protein [Brevibacterium litoralis]|uniref:hypothetical protein n=1 Tax=Brevibacterium litoralis TaxID=3138935 RepID=UPI0032EB096D